VKVKECLVASARMDDQEEAKECIVVDDQEEAEECVVVKVKECLVASASVL
jgi:hypothetical protein